MVMVGLFFVRRRMRRLRCAPAAFGVGCVAPRRRGVRRQGRRRRADGDADRDAQQDPGLARQPARSDLQVRGRARRDVRQGLPRLRPLRERRRRADVDRRSRSAAADHDVEAGRDDRVHAHRVRARAIRTTAAPRSCSGLYSPKDNARASSPPRTAACMAYEVAGFELVPQGENVFLIYKDETWHPAEDARDNGAVSWRWSRRAGVIAFRNPKRDATFYVQLDGRPDLQPVKPADGHDRRSAAGAGSLRSCRQGAGFAQGGDPGGRVRHRRHGRAVHRRRLDVRAEECARLRAVRMAGNWASGYSTRSSSRNRERWFPRRFSRSACWPGWLLPRRPAPTWSSSRAAGSFRRPAWC